MTDSFSRLLQSSATDLEAEDAARASHVNQVAIVMKRFRDGVAEVLTDEKRTRSLHAFALRRDPIYATVLSGMQDEQTARTLIENWMIGQTLATRSRFWLEDVIVDLLRYKCAAEPDSRKRPRIYNYHMLADGWLQKGISIWDLGEAWREQLVSRSVWRESIGVAALAQVDIEVAKETANFEQLTMEDRRGKDRELLTTQQDRTAIRAVTSRRGGAHRSTQLRCNLLLIHPDSQHGSGEVLAIRFVNPGTFAQAPTIREERTNLLRLHAFLAQEKPFRAPQSMRVVVADLVPRGLREDSGARERSHFSPLSRWNAESLWQHLAVPFAAVRAGIRQAGFEAGEILRQRNS